VVCGCGISLPTLPRPERFVTIGVNDVGKLFDPTYLVVLNPRRQFSGDRFQHIERSRAKAVFTQLDLGLAHPGVVRIRLGRYGGTDFDDPTVLHYTRNSPYVAVCLAVHMGAKRIGLVGVDFTDHHFFGQTGRHVLAPQLPQINKEYEALAEACRNQGITVVNLGEQSRLTAFAKCPAVAFPVDPSVPIPAQSRNPMPETDPVAPPVRMQVRGTPVSTGTVLREERRSRRPKVFVVTYRFLSCGDVFTQGFRVAARQLGVELADSAWDDPSLQSVVEAFGPDLLLVIHGRKFSRRWGNTFRRFNTAVWLVDEPYEVDDTSSWSGRFETVFLNDPSTLDRHANAHYLPAAFDPEMHAHECEERPHAVGFVGGANTTRERWLDALAEQDLLSYVVGGPWRSSRLRRLCLAANIPAAETAALYRRTRIIVNVFRDQHHFNRRQTAAWSLNPRVYEALACGALVVSQARPELSCVFPQLPSFTDGNTLVFTVGDLLSDPERLADIRAACVRRLAEHTYADRLRKVLDLCLEEGKTMATPAPGAIIEFPEKQRAATSPLPAGWMIARSRVETEAEGELLLRLPHRDGPGAETGIATDDSYGNVVLSFDVLMDETAVFLAKIHQQRPLDQTSNSYHLVIRANGSYLARHHRILRFLSIDSRGWRTISLRYGDGALTVLVDGLVAAAVNDTTLPRGHCFLGGNGGEIRLREISISTDSIPAGAMVPLALPPVGWLAHGASARSDDAGVLVLDTADTRGAAIGLVSKHALTESELSFAVRLSADAAFLARIHSQDQRDARANSYHLIACPTGNYLAKHHKVLARFELKRETWLSIVLRRSDFAKVELFVDGRALAVIDDRQLQSGYCTLELTAGRAELCKLSLRDLGGTGPVTPRHRQPPSARLVVPAPASGRRRIGLSRGTPAPRQSLVTPLPFTAVPRRNLIYHVWPVRGASWRWNIEQLKQRIDVFNGQRLVGIVHDNRSERPEAVMAELEGQGCVFLVRPNGPAGEAITFPPNLSKVASEDRNEVTFYGHAKGVKYGPTTPEPVQRWTEAMYKIALDDWLGVAAHLERHALAGPFRMLGRYRTHRNLAPWHYSGTFFWIRHAHAFARPCLDVPFFYGGVETWPGMYFTREETACLFLDGLRQLPYEPEFWASVAEPAFMEWETERKRVPPPPDLVQPVPFDGHRWPRLEQKPAEFRWWLDQMLAADVRRLLVIGAMHGGVEWHLARVFRAAGRAIDITTVELSPTPDARRAFADAKRRFGQTLRLVVGDSTEPAVRAQLDPSYDAMFVDGDHGYRGVRADWGLAQSLRPRIVGFHDIADSAWHIQCRSCVSRLWREIKLAHRTAERIEGDWGGIGIVWP
jgi:hypothetical protein